jgi:hypothetical protein
MQTDIAVVEVGNKPEVRPAWLLSIYLEKFSYVLASIPRGFLSNVVGIIAASCAQPACDHRLLTSSAPPRSACVAQVDLARGQI